MNLSYWEIDSYFKNVDFTITGSGIVGLSTAYHLALKYPKSKILILEKGLLPKGASTKNAGFACFGTLSEIISYLQHDHAEDIYKLVERRYKGLLKLRNLLGDATIHYEGSGGYELFREEDRELMENTYARLHEINKWLKPIFGTEPYRHSNKNFGFSGIMGQLETPFEGHIHTGQMMKALTRLVQSKGVTILNHCEVTHVNDEGTHVNLQLQNGIHFTTRKLALCMNAFTRKLYDLPVVPARAQVIVTKPLANIPIKGCFHFDEGYYFFRNTGNRILFGGGRNLDIEGETTMEFGLIEKIQQQLAHYLQTLILPHQPIEIEYRWSGIMGMGPKRNPILEKLSENVC